MNRKTLLIALLFVFSLATVGFIVAKVHAVHSKQGFTLHLTQTAYPSTSSEPFVVATSIRYQRSDGSWRKDTTYSDGRIAVGFSQLGRGVFNVNEKNQRLDYLGDSSGHVVTEEMLRADAAFVGEETILGYKTFHIHSDSTIAPGEYLDSYICPALQGYPLRTVSGSKVGKTVFEVTEVKLGEPSFAVPDYSVDTTQFEKLQKARAGNTP